MRASRCLAWLGVLTMLARVEGDEAAVPRREVRLVMGTPCEVQVGIPVGARARAAIDAAFAALDRVDRALSLWHESELTRLNREGRIEPSSDLTKVLVHALDVAAASGGAFDPTVEPLVRAMGGTGQPRQRLNERRRQEILARIGFARVHLDRERGQVELDPGTTLDLGGIAKGYAADLAVDAMRRAGALTGLVDLGRSSIGVFGEPVALQIRDPEGAGAEWGAFVLAEGHVSTSADDQRKGHILDPRTGRPAHRVLAATVIAATGMEADALSTAVFVLGDDEGLDLLRRRNVQGFVLLRESGRRVIRSTTGFAAAHRLTSGPGVVVRE